MEIELSERQVKILKGTLESYTKVLRKLKGKKGLPGGREKYKRELEKILARLKEKL